jgi:hypothetical protein
MNKLPPTLGGIAATEAGQAGGAMVGTCEPQQFPSAVRQDDSKHTIDLLSRRLFWQDVVAISERRIEMAQRDLNNALIEAQNARSTVYQIEMAITLNRKLKL